MGNFDSYWKNATDAQKFHITLMVAYMETLTKSPETQDSYVVFLRDAFFYRGKHAYDPVIFALRNIDPDFKELCLTSFAYEYLRSELEHWQTQLRRIPDSSLRSFFEACLGSQKSTSSFVRERWKDLLEEPSSPETLMPHVQSVLYQRAFGANLTYFTHPKVQELFSAHLKSSESAFVKAMYHPPPPYPQKRLYMI